MHLWADSQWERNEEEHKTSSEECMVTTVTFDARLFFFPKCKSSNIVIRIENGCIKNAARTEVSPYSRWFDRGKKNDEIYLKKRVESN